MLKKTGPFLILTLVFAATAAAQWTFPCICCDGTTQFLAVQHLTRSSSNNVDALEGTEITGDYWYLWEDSVTASESVGSTTLHSGSDSVGYGSNAGLQWNDAPSARGAGTYSLSGTHVVQSSCGDYSSLNTSVSLTVNQPTITGNSSVWYLGNGQYQTGYSYLNPMTANKNCGPADTCNDTPTWSATGNTSEISFSCNPCVNQTVTAEARSNTFQDIQLAVSIGGFASNPMPFTVYAPYMIVCCATGTPKDAAFNDGYLTQMNLTLYDRFSDPMEGLAMNESFLQTSPTADYPGLNLWAMPIATSQSAGWVSVVYDFFSVYGGCSSATPQCTNPQSPLSPTKAMHVQQSWQAGSSNIGQGVQIRTDSMQYYVDHGRYFNEVTPTQP